MHSCVPFAARKLLEHLVPIVRTDNDIDTVLDRPDSSINSIIDLFIKADANIHVMRAIEPNFRFTPKAIQYRLADAVDVTLCGPNENCLRIASHKQIGDAIIKSNSS